MPIAIDGQKFEDEFQYAASQMAEPANSQAPIISPEEDLSGIPRITVTPRPKEEPVDPQFANTQIVVKDPRQSIVENANPEVFWNKFKINKDVWNKMLDAAPDIEFEDRRTPDDIKYEQLYHRFQTTSDLNPNKLTDSELSWLKSEHILRQIRHVDAIDQYNRERGFDVPNKKLPRPQQANPSTPSESLSDDASKAQEAPLSYGGEKLRTAFRRLTGTGGEDRVETWPEKAARGLISGFMLPGDVASGAVDPDSAEARGRALELAQGMIFGPAPVANKIVDGTLGSFAGVKALTANRANLDLATQMAEKGMDRDQIYEATGWWKGLEGKWRHEIPDGKAKFTDTMVDASHRSLANPENIQRGTLDQVLKHPALFKAYPALKDIEFQIDNKLNALGSHLTAPNGKETISLNLEKIIKDERYHPLEIVLHEIQHAIQREEGFNPGSSPARALQKALEFIRDRKDSLARGEREVPGDKFTEWDRLRQLETLIAKNPKTQFGDRLGDVIYRRTPGEIEPRAIELRSAVERKYGEGSLKEPPYHTVEGVADPLAFPGEIAR